MKNSILYIVGAVVLLGGGAFLFLKNKKNKDVSKLTVGGTTGASTTGGAIVGGTPANPEEDLKKLQLAKDIAIQLKDLRKTKEPIKATIDKYSSKGGVQGLLSLALSKRIAEIDKKSETLNITLKAMGYTELDGNIVKIT